MLFGRDQTTTAALTKPEMDRGSPDGPEDAQPEIEDIPEPKIPPPRISRKKIVRIHSIAEYMTLSTGSDQTSRIVYIHVTDSDMVEELQEHGTRSNPIQSSSGMYSCYILVMRVCNQC